MTKRQSGWVWGVVGVAVAALVIVFARREGFEWGGFLVQLRHVSLWRVALAVGAIYVGLWMRLVRWAVLCSDGPASGEGARRNGAGMNAARTNGAGRNAVGRNAVGRNAVGGFGPEGARAVAGAARPVRPMELMAPMAMGFTAVALFGRLADLVRAYLIARQVERTLSSQVAVYTMERMLDLGAAAVVFSAALAFTPRGLEHRERFVRVGVGSLAGTLAIGLFALAVRWKGEEVGEAAGRWMGRISKGIGKGAREKILGFQEGSRGIRTAGEFGLAALLSMGMWGLIGLAYWMSLRAFAGTPGLGTVGFSRAMLLMAVSLGGSLAQLPVVGWFTQIALLAVAIHGFYGAPVEAATACGAVILLTTSLSILPAGLWFAWKGGVSLRAVAEESGAVAAQVV